MEAKIIYQPKNKKLETADWIIISGVVFIGLGFMIFRPVPILPESELTVLKGTVIEIYEGGVKDVNFKLAGHREIFYVNRGLERGLSLKDLQVRLINQNITVKYPDHWSLLNLDKRVIHISKMELQGKTIFTEAGL